MSKLTINPKCIDYWFPIWEVESSDTPYSREFFELEGLWIDNSLVDGKHTFYGKERKEFNTSFSQDFNEWLDNFKRENNILEFIGNTLELPENEHHFYRLFPIENSGVRPLDFIKNKCSTHYRIMRDDPGYKMANHFDNRAVLGNFFINLTDNSGVSTHFINTFTTGNQNVIDPATNIHYIGPTDKNKGIFFLNTSDTYHGISNPTENSRFIMNILVFFPELTY